MISMVMVLRTTSRDLEMSLIDSIIQISLEMLEMIFTTLTTETSQDISDLRSTSTLQRITISTNSKKTQSSIPTSFMVDLNLNLPKTHEQLWPLLKPPTPISKIE